MHNFRPDNNRKRNPEEQERHTFPLSKICEPVTETIRGFLDFVGRKPT